MIVEDLKKIDLFKNCNDSILNQVKDNLKTLDEKNGITILVKVMKQKVYTSSLREQFNYTISRRWKSCIF